MRVPAIRWPSFRNAKQSPPSRPFSPLPPPTLSPPRCPLPPFFSTTVEFLRTDLPPFRLDFDTLSLHSPFLFPKRVRFQTCKPSLFLPSIPSSFFNSFFFRETPSLLSFFKPERSFLFILDVPPLFCRFPPLILAAPRVHCLLRKRFLP